MSANTNADVAAMVDWLERKDAAWARCLEYARLRVSEANVSQKRDRQEHYDDLLAMGLRYGEAAALLQSQQAEITRLSALTKPRTATELTAIIQQWLDADDASHWGEFEKALDQAISTQEPTP